MTRKEKKNKDRFSMTVFGMLIYSLILIGVMGGSYIGVKAILRNNRASAITTVDKAPMQAETVALEEEDTTEEETQEESPKEDSQPVEEVQDEREISLPKHNIDIEKILDEETGLIDYSIVNFKSVKRKNNAKWKDNVFSRIENVHEPSEAPVNVFDYNRKKAMLVDGSPVEYQIYTNPDNEQIEKITEIVDIEGEYKIYDYYYDMGNINYIAQCRMNIDKPIPISSSEIEARYYYSDDALMKFIYCENGKATEYSAEDLKTYSDGTIDQYEYLEDEMINRAYDVWNLAGSLKETEEICGYVLDEFGMPLENASVKVTSDANGKEVASATTDGDGYYKMVIDSDSKDTDSVSTYTITVSQTTLNDVKVYGITAKEGSGKYVVAPVYMNYVNNVMEYNVSIVVRDAFDSTKGPADAKINIRKGINCKEGDIAAEGTLDKTGSITIPLAAGCYTAEVIKGGYETAYFSVVVRMDHQACVGFAVPDVRDDEYCVVLSWETAPLDLDIKAVSSNQNRVIKSAVDSLGSIMAEGILIKNAGNDDFRIYVSDFGSITAGDGLAYSLTGSNAVVAVYDSGGLISDMHVPVGCAGICWEAYEIRNQQVLPINSYFYTIDDSSLWTTK